MTTPDHPLRNQPSFDQASCRNRLLSLMAADDFDVLARHLERAQLAKGLVLARPDGPIDWVYFPETGIVSVVAVLPNDMEAAIGLFGCDGVGPVPIVLGSARSPYRVIIQVAGEAYRIEATTFTRLLGESASLASLLQRFALVMSIQTAFTALTHAVHMVDVHLARWLLMCHDRVDGNEIALTQEFLATMLAVRRPTVTTTMQLLEGKGLVQTRRGSIVIRDRKALENFAGEAYGRPEAEYARLIGAVR